MLKTICENYFTFWPVVECGFFNSVEQQYCCLKKRKLRMIYTSTEGLNVQEESNYDSSHKPKKDQNLSLNGCEKCNCLIYLFK